MGDDNPFADDSAFDDVNLLGTESGSSNVLSDPSIQRQLQEQDDIDLDEFGYDEQVIGTIENGSVSGQIGGGGSDARSSLKGAQSSESSSRDYEQPTASKAAGFCGFLSIEYYRPYFDVDTEDVAERLKRVVMPWKKDFFQVLDRRPDFYGPFWICTTLVFLIAATSNFASWLKTDSSETPWQHDFKVLSVGSTVVFGFAIAMPLVAWACFHYLGVSTKEIAFSELACVYGYSIGTFCVACILCTVPNSTLEWLSVLTASGFSSVFLIRSLWERLGATEEGGYLPPMATPSTAGDQDEGLVIEEPNGKNKKAAILLCGLLGLHFVFAMIMKLQFFSGSQI